MGTKSMINFVIIINDTENSIQLFRELLFKDNDSINYILLKLLKLNINDRIIFTGTFNINYTYSIECIRTKIINFNNNTNYIEYIITNLEHFNTFKNRIMQIEYSQYNIFSTNSLLNHIYSIEIKLPFDDYEVTNICLIDWINLEVQQTGE